jgi:MFS transporter, PPP family, 3-phenylpropionic acid transporter
MNKTDKLLSLQIAGLQGFYWMIFLPIASFASVYLLSKNFSNQKIGWVMAISSVLAIVLQPALGALIDRFEKLSLKGVLCTLSLICVAFLACIIFLNTGLVLMAVFYVGIVALLYTMQPLVSALTFEYINAGHNVSFGITRASGSICFAVLSTFVGMWVNRYSTSILPIICLILFAGYILIILTFPNVKRSENQTYHIEKSASQPELDDKVGFLRRYDRFIPFLLGAAFLFMFHTVINNFLAQILRPLGGTDTDLGISLTIAAVAELPAFLGFSFIVAKINTRSLMKIAGFIYVLRSFIFLFAASVWMINVGQVFQGLTFAVFIPASVYYINEIMHEKDRVKGQTFVTAMGTLGGFFGNVIGGRLLDMSGVFAMLLFGVVGAVIGSALLFYAIRKPKAKTPLMVDNAG